jgi:hypothetical protein
MSAFLLSTPTTSRVDNRPVIDDPDDTRIGRHDVWKKRKGGFATADEEDVFADPRPDRIYANEAPSGRTTVGRQRLEKKQLEATQVFVLLRRNDRSDHLGQLHDD